VTRRATSTPRVLVVLRYGTLRVRSWGSLKCLVSCIMGNRPVSALQFLTKRLGAVTSLSFGQGSELFLCEQQRLWRIYMGEHVEGQVVPVGAGLPIAPMEGL
jgi:hypothetical protein